MLNLVVAMSIETVISQLTSCEIASNIYMWQNFTYKSEVIYLLPKTSGEAVWYTTFGVRTGM